MLNLHSWMGLQETEAGILDVEHYSLPVEQTSERCRFTCSLAEVRPGIQGVQEFGSG